MKLDAREFLSQVADKVGTMETQQIASLLFTGGIAAELVYEGPSAACPHCSKAETGGLAAAA